MLIQINEQGCHLCVVRMAQALFIVAASHVVIEFPGAGDLVKLHQLLQNRVQMVADLSVGVNQLLIDIVDAGSLRRQGQHQRPATHEGLVICIVSIRHTDIELLQHLPLAAGPFDKWDHGRRIHNISPFFLSLFPLTLPSYRRKYSGRVPPAAQITFSILP